LKWSRKYGLEKDHFALSEAVYERYLCGSLKKGDVGFEQGKNFLITRKLKANMLKN
jgi:hypothetical protein